MSDITVEIVGEPSISVEVSPVGATGSTGDDGDPGVGVPAGGTTGQVLAKNSDTDYDTEWVDAAAGGGAGAWGGITGTLSDQTDLQAALDGKSPTGHTHAQSDVTGLDTALAGKSDTGHTHPQSDVTGLSTALAGKADSTHSHAQSDVTGLVTALAGKSDTGHTHTAADVTDFDAEVSGNTDVAANTAARHAHSNAAVLDATTASFTTADETKLDGVASGATANDTDANLKNRANHTGTQTASTISDFDTAADARVAAGITGKIDKSASVTAIVAITRTAYDALGTPDATTLYLIDESL
jgi:hypothetical protein